MQRGQFVSRSRTPSPRNRPGDSPKPGPTTRPRKRDRPQLDNLTAQSGKNARSRDGLEHEADEAAKRIQSGERVTLGKADRLPPSLIPPGGGRPLRPEARQLGERGLGIDPNRVRVHDDRDAQLTAAALGARAFADGSHIWLGPGASEHDRELMAHELAHVAQGEPGLHLRAATWLERRAWLSFFDHYLPRKFLNNYMDDTGAPIMLTEQEMIDVNPIVNLRRSEGFATELAALQAQVKASNAAGTPAPAAKPIAVSGPGQAITNGTLGNFTIYYMGMLTVNPDGNWVFNGTMEFYDVWDFDPKPFGSSGRSTAGEVKTRVAAAFLPGKPFEISSLRLLCMQNASDQRAVWAGGTPQFINDKAGRAGADIAVGDVGGGEVGGEVGAQSAEDLNP